MKDPSFSLSSNLQTGFPPSSPPRDDFTIESCWKTIKLSHPSPLPISQSARSRLCFQDWVVTNLFSFPFPPRANWHACFHQRAKRNRRRFFFLSFFPPFPPLFLRSQVRLFPSLPEEGKRAKELPRGENLLPLPPPKEHKIPPPLPPRSSGILTPY